MFDRTESLPGVGGQTDGILVDGLGVHQDAQEAAARNEKKLLQTARSLLRSPDASKADMRDIAQAAGVGVGTLYRRFGDKAGLLAAVIGDDERVLQEAVLHGPAPLGPGAAADERPARHSSTRWWR
jgi:AcrR family transcriptional regulator